MSSFLARNRQSLVLAGVFLLAFVVAHFLNAETDGAAADPHGLVPLVGHGAGGDVSAAIDGAATTSPKRRRSGSARGGRYTVIEVEEGGTIEGTVRFASAPSVWSVPVSKDEEGCRHTSHPSERVVFDAQTLGVANCVISLVDISEGKDWTGDLALKDRTAVIDQRECKYVPHILSVRAKTQVNVRNSDVVVHNIHVYKGSLAMTQSNFFTQPNSFEADVGDAFLTKPDKYIVGCDIHPWMNAYVWVFSHPYFSVTAKDGTFRIENVPPGTYTLRCWHEGMQEVALYSAGAISGYDYGDDFEEDREVDVKPGATAKVSFEIPTPAAPK